MNPFGPVFVKEMLETARRRRYFFFRATLAVFLLFLFFDQMEDYGWIGSMRSAEQARIAAGVFHVWIGAQAILVGALIPIFSGGLIASERERGSLDLLFTTQLTSTQIIWGKMGSRLVIVALAIFGSAPVLVILSLFGGISTELLLRAMWITFANGVLIGAVRLAYCAQRLLAYVASLRS